MDTFVVNLGQPFYSKLVTRIVVPLSRQMSPALTGSIDKSLMEYIFSSIEHQAHYTRWALILDTVLKEGVK